MFCYRKDSTMSHSDALKTAAVMILLNAFGGLWMAHMYLVGHYNSIKVRVAVCSLIYRKVSHKNPISVSHAFYIQSNFYRIGIAVITDGLGRHGAWKSGEFVIKRPQSL